MYKFTRSISMLCLFLAPSAACFSQNKTSIVKETNELKTIYAELDKARLKRDIKVLEKYFADDYEFIGEREKVSRSEILEPIKELFEALEEISVSFSKIESAKFSGGKYVLKISGVIKGKAKEDGKTHFFEAFTESTDYWIKDRNGWRLKNQSDSKTLMFIDGEQLYSD